MTASLHTQQPKTRHPMRTRLTSVQCGRTLLTTSLLCASLTCPALALGADELDNDHSRNQTVRQTITPREELIEKMGNMASVRVVMHAQKRAERLAGQLQSLLVALGVDQIENRIVDNVPDTIQVRYFHQADAEAGQAVGEALSLIFDEVAVRSFESYQPAPADGLVEVWIR